MAVLRAAGLDAVALAGDVRDEVTFAADFTVLIHLAGAMPYWFAERGDEGCAVNIEGTRQAAYACLHRDARLVLASTAGVYDRTAKGGLGESALLGPPNPYAASKLAAEQAVTAMGPHHCMLRLFNVYGHGQGDDMLIGYLAARALAGEPITVNNPVAQRDFVHVSDVVAAFMAAALAPVPPTLVNIGSGVAVPVGDVARGILARAPNPGPVRWGDNQSADSVYARIDEAARSLNWSPAMSLEAGLDEVMGRTG